MFITILFWFIVFYLMFRFVFGFVVPLITTTRQIRTKMKDVHQNMQDFQQTNQTKGSYNSTSNTQTGSNVSKGDYIDFEEIK
jgi:hypothetical protein